MTYLSKDNLWIYKIEDTEIEIYRLERPISLKDPLSFLASQKAYPLVYWKNKHDKSMTLSISKVFEFSSSPNISLVKEGKKEAPKFFGGQHFSLKKDQYSNWETFAPPGFFLPEIEITLDEEGNGTCSIHILKENAHKNPEAIFEKIQLVFEELENFKEVFLDRINLPNFSSWVSLVEKCKKDMESSDLKKIVLARSSYFYYNKKINPFSLLKKAEKKSENSTVFLWATSSEEAFIGISPEHLYKKQQSNLTTQALAGTRKRGATEQEDDFLSNELMSSVKDQEEFSYVSNFLQKMLAKLCFTYTKEKKNAVYKTGSLLHLEHSFSGDLKESISDKDLISYLHPTPAVGGFPKETALALIEKIEPFFRGYYASPIGWLSPSSSDVIVAIRSALIKENCAIFFAGCGIIDKSDPKKEWEELEHKIGQFLKN